MTKSCGLQRIFFHYATPFCFSDGQMITHNAVGAVSSCSCQRIEWEKCENRQIVQEKRADAERKDFLNLCNIMFAINGLQFVVCDEAFLF